MGDSTLNHLMMLHVHKDRTDALTLVDVLANDFVGEKENRKQLFGKFSANDILRIQAYLHSVYSVSPLIHVFTIIKWIFVIIKMGNQVVIFLSR